MSGGKVHRIQDIRRRRAARESSRRPRNHENRRQHDTPQPELAKESFRKPHRRRAPRRKNRVLETVKARLTEYAGVAKRNKKATFIALACAGVIVLIFALIAQSSGAAEQSLPVDPGNAGPDTVLAEVQDIEVSTPVRPENLIGLGYHPGGDSFLELKSRGENLSGNPLLGIFGTGGTPENIRYYVMDRAEREGPRTGALDVGAEAGAEVYAPVSGVVTAIRPDSTLQNASVVEIKPTGRTDIRIYVSLVQDPSSDIGPGSPVTAGETLLGTVADSAAVLEPQLSSYVEGPGNHVTIFALQVS